MREHILISVIAHEPTKYGRYCIVTQYEGRIYYWLRLRELIRSYRMKVSILGNSYFSGDMQRGFVQAGYDAQVIKANNAQQMEKILEYDVPDILITLGAPLELNLDAMAVVAKRNPTRTRHIHWDTDGISSRYYTSISGDGIEMDVIYAANPDLVLTMCPEMYELMQSKQIPCEMMHYAYCPLMHHPINGIQSENGPVSLIGNCYSVHYQNHPDHYRYQSIRVLLKPLLQNGYAVQFYGDPAYRSLIFKMLNIDVPQSQFHGYVAYEKTCGIYNGAFINITTQNHKNTITKRTFEILGSGGFVLSSDNEELRKLFVPGRDLVTSSSPEQTLELVEYYKTHPDDYREIRQNAVRSVVNHTYKQRAEYILELCRKRF